MQLQAQCLSELKACPMPCVSNMTLMYVYALIRLLVVNLSLEIDSVTTISYMTWKF